MKVTNQYIVLISVLLLGLAGCSDNQNGHFHNQGAHVHGLVKMNVAVDSASVYIDVTSPAVNFVGFEYQAVTDQEAKQAEQSQNVLKQASNMFSFDGAKCEVQQVEVDFSDITGDSKHEHEHEHEHEHASVKTSRGSHSDIKARYVFACGNTSTLKSMNVYLFDYFKSVENVNMLWVTQNGQGAKNLTAKNSKEKRIIFK